MIRMILGKRLILTTRRIGGLANNLTVGQLYCRITAPPEKKFCKCVSNQLLYYY
jgi:hypothetical protein